MDSAPEKSFKRYDCSADDPATLFIETSEVCPERRTMGQRINHRLRYALCPSGNAVSAKGKFVRRLTANGVEVLKDEREYVFLAGTWTVDANITIPPDAPHGIYILETLLSIDNKQISAKNRFFVESP